MIGSGASCKVISIQETITRKKYAAKCISKEYITKKKTPDRLNRLHNEIAILRAIENHEHLVKLYDIFEGE
jgi:cell cycle serine/threonine-protein kinase CDC5/MSD2/calcium/calmodulin-dependent protein kinase I